MDNFAMWKEKRTVIKRKERINYLLSIGNEKVASLFYVNCLYGWYLIIYGTKEWKPIHIGWHRDIDSIKEDALWEVYKFYWQKSQDCSKILNSINKLDC